MNRPSFPSFRPCSRPGISRRAFLPVAALGLAALATITGPNLPSVRAAEESGGKKLRVGLTVPTLVNPFFVGMAHGVQDRCTALGYELIAPNANNDMSTQINQMEDLITKRVDVIIICPINAKAVVPSVKKANAAKIPVIALDRGSDGGELASFIETNNVEMGQKGADWIAEKLKARYGSAKGNVVNLQGLRGTTAAESREKGFMDGLKQYPEIKLVASQAANFDQERALNLMTDILQANAKVDAVFCANDDNAVGALRAIDAAHRFKPVGDNGRILVLGIDGTGQALQAIRDGKLDATISQNPVKMAATAVDFARDLSAGKSIEKRVYYPNLLLTRENLDSAEAKAYGLWGEAK
ncbi:MAG TPA: sugar ABC transporter substrate-binding protein [Chthoniobacterales bacterium]